VVDSTQTVLGLRALVDLGCVLRDQGLGAEEIVAQLEEAKGRVRLLAIVDTLEYLHKGGRLPAAVSIVGGLLKVKPVISLEGGAIRLVGKGVGVKGSLAALAKQLDLVPDRDPRLPVYYGYTADDSLCRQLVALGEEKFGPHPHQVQSVGAVIGTHVGPGAAVIVYLAQG
jgi:DegV family protein with EDD domain